MLRVGDSGQNLKMTKILNSVKFIMKTSVNHAYNRIWSSWLTFTVLQWMKKNFKISQFSKILLTSFYVVFDKIWKWLKLRNSVEFIKKTLVNQVNILIWHFDWLSKFYSEWRKTSKFFNFRISEKVRVCYLGQNLIMTKTF